MHIICSIFTTEIFWLFQMYNMTLLAKNIVATVLSAASIIGCLALFIYVTRSRELEGGEEDSTDALSS